MVDLTLSLICVLSSECSSLHQNTMILLYIMSKILHHIIVASISTKKKTTKKQNCNSINFPSWGQIISPTCKSRHSKLLIKCGFIIVHVDSRKRIISPTLQRHSCHKLTLGAADNWKHSIRGGEEGRASVNLPIAALKGQPDESDNKRLTWRARGNPLEDWEPWSPSFSISFPPALHDKIMYTAQICEHVWDYL